MKFGPVALRHAIGSIVAHAVRRDGLVLKKGDVVRPDHLPALEAAGLSEIVLAQLETGDVGAHSEAVEDDVFDPLNLWKSRDDAQRTGAGDKTLLGERDALTADGLPDRGGVAHGAQMGLIDGVGTNCRDQ